jgi:hypothetical protein
MEFEQVTRFDENYWFSGIYKISSYMFHQGYACPRHYHAFYLPPNNKHWGDYVGGREAQYDKTLTFDQVKALCVEHAKSYSPTAKQLKQAEIAKTAWAC